MNKRGWFIYGIIWIIATMYWAYQGNWLVAGATFNCAMLSMIVSGQYRVVERLLARQGVFDHCKTDYQFARALITHIVQHGDWADEAPFIATKLSEYINPIRMRVDRAYSERAACAAALARMALESGFNAGTGVDKDGQPVLYVDTPNGQVSWHIAEHDLDVLKGLPVYGRQWDGTFRSREKDWSIW